MLQKAGQDVVQYEYLVREALDNLKGNAAHLRKKLESLSIGAGMCGLFGLVDDKDGSVAGAGVAAGRAPAPILLG